MLSANIYRDLSSLNALDASAGLKRVFSQRVGQEHTCESWILVLDSVLSQTSDKVNSLLLIPRFKPKLRGCGSHLVC